MVVVMGVLVVVLVVFAATTVSARDTQCVLGQASPCCFAAWRLEARWEFRLAVLMKSIALHRSQERNGSASPIPGA